MTVKGKVVQEQSQILTDVVQMLPWEIQEQARDFIEFLLEKRVRQPGAALRLDWRGSLRDWQNGNAHHVEIVDYH